MTSQPHTPAPDEPETDASRRHDAFNGRRKRDFLDALGTTGCLRDAARKAGVSHQTVYNHQKRDPAFARQCELALDMAGTDVELHAWERGVVGVEEPIVHRGEIVGYRRKRSDAVLRLLLQATKPKKYGLNPGFSRKRLAKAERRRIEEEVRAEWRERAAQRIATQAETDAALTKKLDLLERRIDRERTAQGWSRDEDRNWIPPGWVRAAAPVPFVVPPIPFGAAGLSAAPVPRDGAFNGPCSDADIRREWTGDSV